MSRSAKVNTVSRCIAARSLGIPATITRSAAPWANSAAATWVMRLARRALAHAR